MRPLVQIAAVDSVNPPPRQRIDWDLAASAEYRSMAANPAGLEAVAAGAFTLTKGDTFGSQQLVSRQEVLPQSCRSERELRQRPNE